jgi:hypothetical protein
MQSSNHEIDRNESGVVSWIATFKRFAGASLSDPRAEAAALLILVPVMLSIAFWNGFPIIFYDTGAYLLEGLGRVFLPERSPVYSLLLDYAGARSSLWFVAILQGTLTAFVIVETTRAIAPRISLIVAIAIAACLAAFTGLPWYAGQIEPDCFVALAVLSLYLLTFQHGAIKGGRDWALVATAALSVAVHPSHLILAVGLLLAILVYRGLRRILRADGWPAARVLQPAIGCVLGLCLIVAANYELTGKLFVSRSGPGFVFARLLQDGIVMRLLDDTCPQSHYQLCAYKDALPRTADQWLWNTSSPFFALKKFSGTNDESSRIIWDSLRRYPGLHLKAALVDTARQFVAFKTGDQIEPQEWVLSAPLKQFIPGQMHAYLSARQQLGEINFRPINWVHVTVAWLSLLALVPAFYFAVRRNRIQVAIFVAFIFLALLGNAAVCGVLSNPHNRYQSRLIWLPSLALLLIAGDRQKFALRGVPESGT